jgi:UDP-N-acetylglucosamine--N-acetylmuramyl-(pentapeptide) pyrophosphoryl-undecaprenol N-acetylglucosamine transferase
LPIRKNLDTYDKASALKEFNFDGKKPILLVFGGSLGARKINEVLKNSLNDLLKDFDVLHLTGKNNAGFVAKKGYTPLPYLDDMAKAYSIASVIVSRCGANSAFEILSLNKPCVFIPLSKKASRGDQIENAKHFSSKGYADLLEEEFLTPTSLIKAVKSAYKKGRSTKPAPVVDATEKIVDVLYRVADNSYYI